MISDQATDAAINAGKKKARVWNACDPPTSISAEAAKQIVNAAHSPALGLDRSVCLRDVVGWLRSNSEDALDGQGYIERADEVADEIERTFTEGGADGESEWVSDAA